MLNGAYLKAIFAGNVLIIIDTIGPALKIGTLFFAFLASATSFFVLLIKEREYFAKIKRLKDELKNNEKEAEENPQ